MATKYHRSKQGRTHGKYRKRLIRRGLDRAPRMTVYPDLTAKRP
jgi:ribosomal protein L18